MTDIFWRLMTHGANTIILPIFAVGGTQLTGKD